MKIPFYPKINSFKEHGLHSAPLLTFEIELPPLLCPSPPPPPWSLCVGRRNEREETLSLSFLSDQEARTGWWSGNGRVHWHVPWRQERMGSRAHPGSDGTFWASRCKPELSKDLRLWQGSIEQIKARNFYTHWRPCLRVGRQNVELTAAQYFCERMEGHQLPYYRG